MSIFKDWFGVRKQKTDVLRDVTGDFQMVVKDINKHLPNIRFWARAADLGSEYVAFAKVACGPTCGERCRCGNASRCVLLHRRAPRSRIFLDLCATADLAMKPSPAPRRETA